MSLSSVLLANDVKNWWETGPTSDVIIRNKRIYNQDYNRRKWQYLGYIPITQSSARVNMFTKILLLRIILRSVQNG